MLESHRRRNHLVKYFRLSVDVATIPAFLITILLKCYSTIESPFSLDPVLLITFIVVVRLILTPLYLFLPWLIDEITKVAKSEAYAEQLPEKIEPIPELPKIKIVLLRDEYPSLSQHNAN